MDRSVAFYRDVVGLSVGSESDYGTVKCIGLMAGENMLELMDILHPEAEGNLQLPLKPGEKTNVHVCFKVENIDELAQRVRDSGAVIQKDLFEMELGGGVVIRNFYFLDPDGYALQFLQVKK